MWAILGASIIGVGFFLERMWALQRGRVLPRAFVERIRALVAKGKTSDALLLCEENGSSIALVMAAALRAFEQDMIRADVKEMVEEVGAREVSQMEKFIEIIGTIANISPLLGLLGTVTGMIFVFRDFVDAYASGTAGPDAFAQGIWQALLTTAFGITVGIIMLVLYRVSQGRANTLVNEMEEDAMGLVNLLESARRSARESAPATESA